MTALLPDGWQFYKPSTCGGKVRTCEGCGAQSWSPGLDGWAFKGGSWKRKFLIRCETCLAKVSGLQLTHSLCIVCQGPVPKGLRRSWKGRFCSGKCRKAWSEEQLSDPSQGEATFHQHVQTLSGRPTRCPQCHGLLSYEPAWAWCRYGCGRRWPLQGASLADQFRYERMSGLLQPATPE